MHFTVHGFVRSIFQLYQWIQVRQRFILKPFSFYYFKTIFVLVKYVTVKHGDLQDGKKLKSVIYRCIVISGLE